MSDEKDIWEQLKEPFPIELVELKPGAKNREGTKRMGLAYSDLRNYQVRLDAVVGPENWMNSYEGWGDDRIICSLTINGVTKSDVGESGQEGNGGTTATAQAFKRACSAFGLGRYLYALPSTWVEWDGYKFTGDVDGAIRWMYQQVGIDVGAAPAREASSVVPRETTPNASTSDADFRIKNILKRLQKNDSYATKLAHDKMGTTAAWQRLSDDQKQELAAHLSNQLDVVAATG